MANNVVRKCCTYRARVLLQAKRNPISVECGMGYHTPKTTIPYQTSSPPPPFHYLISIHKAMKLCLSTQTPKSSGMAPVLKKHTTSIFRQPPEDASSIFL